ncbi:MAG: hypothetical protein HFJ97_00005 [Eubacterium sp.]|nr:hypothetical protein [Eubacterium sp.]
MKDKFLRILSPITLAVVAILDAAVIGYGIYAIKRLIAVQNTTIIIFALCDLAALIIAVLVTKEVLSNGVKFYSDEMEFTGLDKDSIFAYADIEKVETEKDTKPSFVKNFIDRQSKVILTLKDERVVTVDVGLTTKNGLAAIEKEINERISNA